MDETGRLEALWVKRFKRGPMDPKTTARLVAGRGIEGNANQGGKRQVTVISAEAWKRVSEELGRPADPSWRRANLLVSGVDLRESRGKMLRVGPVKISVSGETRPCERMDEACQGLRTVLASEWRGGVFGEVLDDGEVSVGDPVGWVEKE
jgi:MOSC domain-containing protein YiiM